MQRPVHYDGGYAFYQGAGSCSLAGGAAGGAIYKREILVFASSPVTLAGASERLQHSRADNGLLRGRSNAFLIRLQHSQAYLFYWFSELQKMNFENCKKWKIAKNVRFSVKKMDIFGNPKKTRFLQKTSKSEVFGIKIMLRALPGGPQLGPLSFS